VAFRQLIVVVGNSLECREQLFHVRGGRPECLLGFGSSARHVE
jgi:hypothetical protein